MNLLDGLAIKYGADKTPAIKHHYTDVYFDLFKDKREEIFKIVELGIAEGASLRMWKDFFPQSLIIGADNDLSRVDNLTKEGFTVYHCDQSSVRDLGNLLENIGFNVDLFIDDGSHKPEDQLLTCLTLMPYFQKNCIYIIEDVDDELADALYKMLSNKFDVEMLKVGKRHDDRLLIVRHKNG